MKILFDFFPLILFFAAYKFYGIFAATAVAIIASISQVGLFWLRERRFETTHLVTLAVIIIFGGMTLIFQNDIFIKWKPTIVEWIFAAMILGSHLTGGRTALEFMLGSQLKLPPKIWRRINLGWGLFFLLVGALNLYVAFFFRLDLDAQARTDLWVNFKVFGLMGLTLLFAVIQMLMIAKHIDTSEKDD
jgi:intracellular septation protein